MILNYAVDERGHLIADELEQVRHTRLGVLELSHQPAKLAFNIIQRRQEALALGIDVFRVSVGLQALANLLQCCATVAVGACQRTWRGGEGGGGGGRGASDIRTALRRL